MGVQCHHCVNEHSDKQKERFRMRQLQIELAEARGEPHIEMAMQEVKERQTMVRRAQNCKKKSSAGVSQTRLVVQIVIGSITCSLIGENLEIFAAH